MRRIAQVLLPTATAFEQKCLRIDAAGPAADYVPLAEAELVHTYGPKENVSRPRKWWSGACPERSRRGIPAGVFLSPIEEDGFQRIPEAVEDSWFEVDDRQSCLSGQTGSSVLHIGSFARPSLRHIVPLTLARLHRTREDIEWLAFERPPTLEEMTSLGAWVDPALDPRDFDGFGAEAIVAGRLVVAARTPINIERLESGRTGLLVPTNDPNELAHAILAALFKPEVAQQKIDAARQTKAKFRSRQRLRALARIYESL